MGDRPRESGVSRRGPPTRPSPSEAAREVLRVADQAVPEHNRMFVLGDQDRKDHPIRRYCTLSSTDSGELYWGTLNSSLMDSSWTVNALSPWIAASGQRAGEPGDAEKWEACWASGGSRGLGVKITARASGFARRERVWMIQPLHVPGGVPEELRGDHDPPLKRADRGGARSTGANWRYCGSGWLAGTSGQQDARPSRAMAGGQTADFTLDDYDARREKAEMDAADYAAEVRSRRVDLTQMSST